MYLCDGVGWGCTFIQDIGSGSGSGVLLALNVCEK